MEHNNGVLLTLITRSQFTIELEPRYAPLAQHEAETSRERLVTGVHFFQL